MAGNLTSAHATLELMEMETKAPSAKASDFIFDRFILVLVVSLLSYCCSLQEASLFAYGDQFVFRIFRQNKAAEMEFLRNLVGVQLQPDWTRFTKLWLWV